MAIQSQLAVAETATVTTSFDATWLGFGGVHGGLLLAALAEAAADHVGSIPIGISAHMYAPVQPGEVEIAVDVIRAGRTGSVSATIEGRATALVRTSREPFGNRTWPSSNSVAAAEHPEQLEPLVLPVDFVPFSQYVDIRPVNAARPFAGGHEPEFIVWIRLRENFGLTEQGRAAVLLDALPPGLFATMTSPVLIPTIEMTAHFAPTSNSGSDWYYLRHRTACSTADLSVDETELFTATGELAAQARQLRRIVRKG
ncbi:acyl-CoA thioesterase [Antrihabitans spumae]|uniref:Acyl-CoA thioesterase n=1 Tax=Antrihabitans spumae TaxID=3373370 RepID=A0ABW7JYQ4_9NOCA